MTLADGYSEDGAAEVVRDLWPDVRTLEESGRASTSAAWAAIRRAVQPFAQRAGRLAGWVTVGASGVVVNTAVLWFLAAPLGVQYLWAACLSTQLSSTWNFVFVDRWVFRGDKRGSAFGRWMGFMAFSNTALLARIPALGLLVSLLGMHYLVANVVTLVLTFAVRFAAQERLSTQKGEECHTPSTVG